MRTGAGGFWMRSEMGFGSAERHGLGDRTEIGKI